MGHDLKEPELKVQQFLDIGENPNSMPTIMPLSMSYYLYVEDGYEGLTGSTVLNSTQYTVQSWKLFDALLTRTTRILTKQGSRQWETDIPVKQSHAGELKLLPDELDDDEDAEASV